MKVIRSLFDETDDTITYTDGGQTLLVVFDTFTYAYAQGDVVSGGFMSLRDNNVAHVADIGVNTKYWRYLGERLGASDWVKATTYATNYEAQIGGHVYKSLQDANTGHNPQNSPTWWEDLGVANSRAMFDNLRNTPTVARQFLETVVTPGARFDTCAIIGVLADSVRVRVVPDPADISYDVDSRVVVSAGDVAYDTTVQLLTRTVEDWYDYFFNPFQQKTEYLFEELPEIGSAAIILNFAIADFPNGNANYLEVGNVCIGKAVQIGTVQYGAEDDATNYSSITRDNFGTATLIQRRSVPITNQTVWANKSDVPMLHKLRDDLNAVPAVWSGLDDPSDDYFPALLINGIYRQFKINVAHTDVAVLTLQLEEI